MADSMLNMLRRADNDDSSRLLTSEVQWLDYWLSRANLRDWVPFAIAHVLYYWQYTVADSEPQRNSSKHTHFIHS